jgi:hypothetical protein
MNRAGAALAAVLFILAMAGALVVGGAYAARSAAASVRLGQRGRATESLAEQSLMAMIATWDSSARRAQPLGHTAQLQESGVSIRITRLGATVYLGLAEVQHPIAPRLRRRMAVLIEADSGGAAPLIDRGWYLLP